MTTPSTVNAEFWKGKRVFLTGHTGFKGGWAALWLQQMGAIVKGFSLPPPTSPSLFEQAQVAEGVVEQRTVQANRTLGDQWLVDGGLSAGDRVIVEGLQKVQPGAKANAVEAGASPVAGADAPSTAALN